MELFTNQTTNGDSLEYNHSGGELQIVIHGTFDGASVQAQIKQEGSGAVDVGTAYTDEAAFLMEMRPCTVLFNLSGAGGSTDITLSAI